MALTLPEPVPCACVLRVVDAGADHVVFLEDFSSQTLTSQEPVPLAVTAGVVWLVAAVFTTELAEADTCEAAPPTPR